MMSNSAAPDPALPQKFARWVEEAVEEGRLSEQRVNRSLARIETLNRIAR